MNIRFVVLLFFCTAFCSFSQEYLLRYKSQVGAKNRFAFKTNYKAKMVDPFEVHELQEVLTGYSEEETIERQGEGFKIRKTIHLEQRIHNGEKAEGELVSPRPYVFVQDPVSGKVSVDNVEDYPESSALEMILKLPKTAVKVGEKWSPYYHYDLNVGRQAKIPLEGSFILRGVKDGIARIEGIFMAKIPRTQEVNYVGLVRFNYLYNFNIEEGVLESGRMIHRLRYESRTKLAAKYIQDTRDSEDPIRLGYSIDFLSSFKRSQ
jgi:hypothetical protein